MVSSMSRDSNSPDLAQSLADLKLNGSAECNHPDGVANAPASNKARDAVSRLLRDKEKEWTAVAQKRGPLTLIDLPVDILREIVKEVTHTNDLASLARTHSAFHALAIPQIYSRFDIVWPDSNAQSEPRAGVDALTYGLATLVMAEDVFRSNGKEERFDTTQSSRVSSVRRRRGNYYAQFTRKFSLGNGPSDWVQEYLITKESGKMLGTLVALAVARMHRLESFTWDMPTGVLQDVWDALASLGERSDTQGCRLQKIWIRWHNSSKVEGNHEQPSLPARSAVSFWEPYSAGIPDGVPERLLSKRNRVERPSFSALPPLKSLNVLDIDECAYLDEMSQLIAKSRHCLRELRVGIALHAVSCEWAFSWEGTRLSQHPKDPLVNGTSHWEKRLGGVIGVLVGHIFDVRHNVDICKRSEQGVCELHMQVDETEVEGEENDDSGTALPGTASEISRQLGTDIKKAMNEQTSPPDTDGTTDQSQNLGREDLGDDSLEDKAKTDENLQTIDEPLTLEVLELERVCVSVSFLLDAFDWRTIRDLTILNCPGHVGLWAALCRWHALGTGLQDKDKKSELILSTNRCPSGPFGRTTLGARLQFRKIHTNMVTKELISLIKSLDQNTLETLFLQQSPHYKSNVPIKYIMQAVRHHRGSLKRLLIDSNEPKLQGPEFAHISWQMWMLNREMIHGLTSGRMPRLRELSVAIDQRDWHFLLQRLPGIPHIRSLNLPFISCGDGKSVETSVAREHALQVIDIITLRPDIELCYLGIAGKCFEILEFRVGRGGWRADETAKSPRTADHIDENAEADGDAASVGDPDEDDDDENEDDIDDHDGDDEGDHESDGDTDPEQPANEDELEDESDDSDWDEDGNIPDGGKCKLRFDIREILFYDDKVAIFKARHGRL